MFHLCLIYLFPCNIWRNKIADFIRKQTHLDAQVLLILPENA